MGWFRQAFSFGGVGTLATLAHVTLSWTLIREASWDPYISNLLGTCVAFLISFVGNAFLTFSTNRSLWSCALRYVFVSLSSLVMTSSILAFVENIGLPIYVYVLIVLATVPPTTFFLAKLWAFRSVSFDRREF